MKEVDTFFFSSRRRHTISKRDWSSDVCSSDLRGRHDSSARMIGDGEAGGRIVAAAFVDRRDETVRADVQSGQDRKSVAEGKSVDSGSRRRIYKNKST